MVKLARSAGIVVMLLIGMVQGELTVAANFWNLGWQGIDSYCDGEWGNWKKSFVDEIQIYSCLRFMDWNMVNNNVATTWADRVKKSEGCTQLANAYRPIAYEWMIDVANLVPNCALWLNVPALADQNYVANLARLVHKELAPGRMVYLEYANETWWEPASNPVVNAVAAQIPNLQWDGDFTFFGPREDDIWIIKHFLGHAYLAAQMWGWFHEAWVADGGDQNLLVNVLAGQVNYGNGADARGMLEALEDPNVNPTGIKCDAFAVAPYWRGSPVSNEQQLAEHKVYCDAKGVKLVLYEGGPGEDMVHASPDQMTQFLEMANNYVDGPYCHYCHSGGSWGAVENGYYQAFVDWSQTHPGTANRNKLVPRVQCSSEVFTLTSGTNARMFSLGGRVVRDLNVPGSSGYYLPKEPLRVLAPTVLVE